jgi:MFS family permease
LGGSEEDLAEQALGVSRVIRFKEAASRRVPPALRYPAYRTYWLGTLASVSGFQMLTFGILWVTYELTKSPLFLGYVAAVNALPAIALNLFGGVFADMFDKRRLIIACQLVTASLIFILALMTMFDVLHIYYLLLIAFFAGAVNAFDQPARQALYPHLIDRSVMMSAVSLNAAIWQGTRIVAPAFAGFIIAYLGTSTSFFISGAGFVTMAVVIAALKLPEIPRGGSGNAARDLLDGMKFIAGNSVFSFLIGMTFFNSFFGMAYIFMMPIFAVEILKVGADGQGILMGVGGVGALVTTMLLGSIGNFRQKGLMLIGGAVAFGVALLLFGLTSQVYPSYYLVMAIMLFIGIFNSIYMISIMSSLQMMVPNSMRGRVMGFYGMTWSIMPLGGMQGNWIANYLGAPMAVIIGGVAVIAFAVGPAMLNRQVRNISTLLNQVEQVMAAGRQQAQPTAPSGD